MIQKKAPGPNANGTCTSSSNKKHEEQAATAGSTKGQQQSIRSTCKLHSDEKHEEQAASSSHSARSEVARVEPRPCLLWVLESRHPDEHFMALWTRNFSKMSHVPKHCLTEDTRNAHLQCLCVLVCLLDEIRFHVDPVYRGPVAEGEVQELDLEVMRQPDQPEVVALGIARPEAARVLGGNIHYDEPLLELLLLELVLQEMLQHVVRHCQTHQVLLATAVEPHLVLGVVVVPEEELIAAQVCENSAGPAQNPQT